MKFVARFRNKRSEEDISYYVAELGSPVMEQFEKAVDRLYFAVIRLRFTRIGPTLRGEVLEEDKAKAQIESLHNSEDWEEMGHQFEETKEDEYIQ